MPKNIAIFSDGTGQDGGVRPEQRMSNVYKLYRVCRSGPDSGIDPKDQIAFYDPGLGTDEGATAISAPVRFVQKLLASVTGRGVTINIADCYEFIINHYDEGDRIFLIGFSRGAYTVRAVADLVRLCGVPTTTPSGRLSKYRRATRDIADEAVLTVLEHGAGHPREEFEAERDELARRFREKYGSAHPSGEEQRSNASPYFIGVFDTVASLGAKGLRRWGIQLGLIVAIGVASTVPSAVLGGIVASLSSLTFWRTFWSLVTLGTFAGGAYLLFHVRRSVRKTIRDFPNKGDVKSHEAEWKGENFSRLLSQFVSFARSANAIDETRADFTRLPWGPGHGIQVAEKHEGHEWFKQIWFAGNHSDIGGSYAEAESRLSDISLEWMIEESTEIPNGLIIDGQRGPGDTLDIPRLRLFPDADGVQHCEVAGMADTIARLPFGLAKLMKGRGWAVKVREINPKAEVHPTVSDRFDFKEVVQCAGSGPYRPEALAHHDRFKRYYETPPAEASG